MSADPWEALAGWRDARLGDPIGGGTINEVREVDVHGRRHVARLSTRDGADLGWELSLLMRLADAGLGVTRLVPTAQGELSAGGIVVMEWVDGGQPESTDDWQAVAGYLGRLHEVTAGWQEQRPGWLACNDLVRASRSGPVDLAELPADVLETCREIWGRLPSQRAVIHGDPNPSNIRVHDGEVVFLDWDEARLDNPLLDYVYVPDALTGLPPDDHRIGKQAFYAWEAAMFWTSGPDHARKRLAQIVS